jgi:preprotein translocase subunit YajC
MDNVRRALWFVFLPTLAHADAGAAPGSFALNIIPIAGILLVFYFLIIRPQQKQARQHQDMVNALKRGDRILTQGGLYGAVQNVRGTVLDVKIADNVKVEIEKSSVSRVVPAALEPEVVASSK